MTKLQRASLTRLQALVLFLNGVSISAIINLFAQLKIKVANFVAIVTKIENTLPVSGVVTKDTKNSTTIRNQDFAKMSKLLLAMVKLGKSWGVTSDVKDVRSLFELMAKDFKVAQLDQIALAENSLKVLQDNTKLITANTDIKDTSIDGFAKAVDKAASHKGELRNQIADNKVSNDTLKEYFKEAQTALTSMTESVEGLFSEGLPDANATFLTAYSSLSDLALSVHPTGVRVLFQDGDNNNAPLKGGILSYGAKSVTSGIDGYGTLKKLRAKNGVVITLACEGYETQDKIVNISRGKILDLVVVMRKKV